jgi:XRE family aerobic/anaerobic benzoate catabolism transcriptional regulator
MKAKPGEASGQSEKEAAELGARLRALRARAGITRKQLSARSGTSERYLAQLEAGEGNPSLTVLMAVAAALDVAPAQILPLGGERNGQREAAAALVRRLPAEKLPALHDWIETLGVDEKGRRIVLVGLRGAGKTALGTALAARLNVPFVEMSKEVEQSYGGEIGVLIELGGQAALSRHERAVWDEICAGQTAAVIAAPGGVVADGPLYDRILATAHSIWLEADPEDHMQRVMVQGDFRPMESNRTAMADLKAILEARTADYARAEGRLDTSGQDFAKTLDLLEKEAQTLLNA